MKKKHFFIGYVIMLCMFVYSDLSAQPSNNVASAKAFVQNFYDWYVVFYNKPFNKKNAVAADEAAIKKHMGFFESRLSNSIINDEWAQNRAKGKNVGLGFDPFLAAKNNNFSYVVGAVKNTGNKFLVDIHSDIATKPKHLILTGKTTIIAEVINADEGWMFTNFYYPAGQNTSNLMKMLANLRHKRGEFGN